MESLMQLRSTPSKVMQLAHAPPLTFNGGHITFENVPSPSPPIPIPQLSNLNSGL
jgi:hypothetical protein